MIEPASRISEEQRIIVRERLRLLTIVAYIRGGITVAFSCFFLLYVVMFGIMGAMPESAWTNNNTPTQRSPGASNDVLPSASPTPREWVQPQGPPRALFAVFAALFGGLTLLGWTLGGLTAYAGR